METKVMKKFPCRIEELPVIGGFVFNTFTNDAAGFIRYSPEFEAPFPENFEAKITEVEEIINPKQLTGKQKIETQNIYSNMIATRDLLNKLEGYIGFASNLSIPKKDFGVKEVRDKITSIDAEAYLKKMKDLMNNVNDNLVPLQEKGFTLQAKSELENMITQVKAGTMKRNEIIERKEKLVQENLEKLNELWDMIKKVMVTGKTLYQNTDFAKTNEYKLKTLRHRVRVERELKEKEH